MPNTICTEIAMRIRLTISLLLMSFLIGPSMAQAITTTWQYQSTVIELVNADAAQIAELGAVGIGVGTIISGTIELDLATPDTDVGFQYGLYVDAVVSGTVSIGTLSLSMAPSGYNQGSTFVGTDSASLGAWYNAVPTAGFSAITPGVGFAIYGNISTRHYALNAGILPVDPPDLGVFTGPIDSAGAGVGFFTTSGYVNVKGDLTWIQTVPEPGTASLLALGLAGLGVRRRLLGHC